MELNISSSLKIFSNKYTPDEISHYLGISCTSQKLKGENISPSMKYQENIWILNSSSLSKAWPEEHILWFSNRLNTLTKKLDHLSEESHIELSIVIESNQEPPLNFSAKSIKFLSEIGASLDIDQYIDS